MIKNYFKIAWRNLKRNKAYAAINIIGLSLGIACAILIFVLVSFHFSFDDFHQNKDRIYRVVTELHDEQIFYMPGVPPPFTKALRNDYTFAEKTARVVGFPDRLISILSGKGNKKFQEKNGVAAAESAFFDIFNFPLVEGDPKTALTEPNTAILTQRMAKKYFGDESPMGRVIRIDNKTNFKITGILKDIPFNTDRKQEIYISDWNAKDLSPFIREDPWGGINSETHCFLRLKPGVTAADVERVFPAFKKKYYAGDPADAKAYQFKLQPLADIHFNTDYDGYAEKKYLWGLIMIGIFLIITACVNFINLATAQALNRAKEIGVRKVLGSQRNQLFWQFITETALITFFAMIIAYGLAALGLPYLNRLFETTLRLNPFINISLLIFIFATMIIVIFLSGAYPGLVLSGFQPIEALKGKLSQKNVGGFSLRRVLVVTQFAISQILIISTVVIVSQMHFSKSTDLGFQKEGLIMIPVPENDSIGRVKMETLKTRLLSLSGVEQVSLCTQAPAAESNNNTDIIYDKRPKPELFEVNAKQADNNYIKTFNMKLVAGRNIYSSDTPREVMVNETFVKKLNLASPTAILNKYINIDNRNVPVVGVVKDFYNNSFRSDISAVAIFSAFHHYYNCAVKINLGSTKSTLASIEKIWNDTYPEFVYNYEFLDERIAKFYELDNTLLKLIEVFAGIAVFIGCLGLYGLVSFMAVRKTKEIGVRKVLGASIQNILWLFGKEFSRLLIIAFLIAAPVAWLAMNKYLQDFKYRIEMGFSIFLIAILCTFGIAAVTVSLKSIRAALTNPVKSLRSE